LRFDRRVFGALKNAPHVHEAEGRRRSLPPRIPPAGALAHALQALLQVSFCSGVARRAHFVNRDLNASTEITRSTAATRRTTFPIRCAKMLSRPPLQPCPPGPRSPTHGQSRYFDYSATPKI